MHFDMTLSTYRSFIREPRVTSRPPFRDGKNRRLADRCRVLIEQRYRFASRMAIYGVVLVCELPTYFKYLLFKAYGYNKMTIR